MCCERHRCRWLDVAVCAVTSIDRCGWMDVDECVVTSIGVDVDVCTVTGISMDGWCGCTCFQCD